jgi:hypothetical protein
MVTDGRIPKMLTDLRKIYTGLRVTCRMCGNVQEIDREQLVVI